MGGGASYMVARLYKIHLLNLAQIMEFIKNNGFAMVLQRSTRNHTLYFRYCVFQEFKSSISFKLSEFQISKVPKLAQNENLYI